MFSVFKYVPITSSPVRNTASGPRRRPRSRPLLVLLATTLCLVMAGCYFAGTSGSTASSGSAMTIPLKVVRGSDNSTLASVPVYINGHGPYQFILDTGASISLINSSLARQLALPRAGGRQPVSGVGGTEVIVFVDAANWKVGNVPLPKTSIGSGALPSGRGAGGFQGLLGSDIWSQFGRITIDYNASTLTVYKSIALRFRPSDTVEHGVAEATWWRAA